MLPFIVSQKRCLGAKSLGVFKSNIKFGVAFVIFYRFVRLTYPYVKKAAISCIRRLLTRFRTLVIDWFRHGTSWKFHLLRNAFRETPTPRIAPSDASHTHPNSAAWRSSCTVLSRMLAARIGMVPYAYQCSSADIRDGIEGSRDFYWDKDVMVVPINDKLRADHLVTVVDVDYYLDLEDFLMDINQPILLYSFQPKAVCEGKGEFCFTFGNDSTVRYVVSGGATYGHRVWNFSKDTITIHRGLQSKSFLVERRAANAHHEYVFLIPFGYWRGVGSLLCRLLQSDTIERLDINQGEFNVLDYHDGTQLVRSIGRVDKHNCINIELKKFDAISAVVSNAKIGIGQATMQSWVENDKEEASVLVDYFNSLHITRPPLVFAPSNGVRNFQIVTKIKEYDPEAKPLLTAFMSPIYPNTYVPDKTVGNERASIEGRITAPAKHSKVLAGAVPSKFLVQCMTEFVDLLVPEKHKGIPVDISEVYERQHRPSQRAILEAADISGDSVARVAKTFLKAEPYQKVTDPRTITQYNGVDKRDYSRYTYALTKHVSTFDWYSFGKTPLEISAAVTKICTDAIQSVNCSDANRQDGHVGEIARMLELMIYVAFFCHVYHEEVTGLHERQYHTKVITQLGVKYEIEFQRGSGSAETAMFNTILTKFCDYFARRRRDDSPQVAFSALGQFAGDDLIVADLDGHDLTAAAALVGQDFESVEFVKGHDGVNYLSRFYTRMVWFGNPSSTCDLPRALGKLHVSQALGNVKPVEKLRQKLIGLIRTDRSTPILKQIIDNAVRVGMDLCFDPSAPVAKSLVGWWARYEPSVNWPNEEPDDINSYLESMLVKYDTAPLYKYLIDCKAPEDLLKMPAIASFDDLKPTEVKKTTVVDDTIKVPAAATAPTVGSQVPIPAKEICWKFTEGKCTFGKKCKYEHAKVCKEFLEGKCNRKVGSCRYQHVKPRVAPGHVSVDLPYPSSAIKPLHNPFASNPPLAPPPPPPPVPKRPLPPVPKPSVFAVPLANNPFHPLQPENPPVFSLGLSHLPASSTANSFVPVLPITSFQPQVVSQQSPQIRSSL